MGLLSQSVGYAASALGYLAGHGGGPALVREIAEETGVPRTYLAKIIHALARKGFVNTQRGIGGGVTLARPPAQITLYELCEVMDEPLTRDTCLMGIAPCTDERHCPAHEFWREERDRLVTYLRSTTLADWAAFEARQREPRP